MKTIELKAGGQIARFTTKSVTFDGKEYFYADMSHVINNAEAHAYIFTYEGETKILPYEEKDLKILNAIFSQVQQLEQKKRAKAQAAADAAALAQRQNTSEAVSPDPYAKAGAAVAPQPEAAAEAAVSEAPSDEKQADAAEADAQEQQAEASDNSRQPEDKKKKKKSFRERFGFAKKEAAPEKNADAQNADGEGSGDAAEALNDKAATEALNGGAAETEKASAELDDAEKTGETAAESIGSKVPFAKSVIAESFDSKNADPKADEAADAKAKTTDAAKAKVEATGEAKPEETTGEAKAEAETTDEAKTGDEASSTDAPAENQEAKAEKEPLSPEKKAKLKKSITIFAIIIAAVILASVAYYFIFGSNNSPTENVNSNESQQYEDIDQLIDEMQ